MVQPLLKIVQLDEGVIHVIVNTQTLKNDTEQQLGRELFAILNPSTPRVKPENVTGSKPHIVIDLSNVIYITQAALAQFTTFNKNANASSKTWEIIGAGQIEDDFQIKKLKGMVKVSDKNIDDVISQRQKRASGIS